MEHFSFFVILLFSIFLHTHIKCGSSSIFNCNHLVVFFYYDEVKMMMLKSVVVWFFFIMIIMMRMMIVWKKHGGGKSTIFYDGMVVCVGRCGTRSGICNVVFTFYTDNTTFTSTYTPFNNAYFLNIGKTEDWTYTTTSLPKNLCMWW